MTGVAMRLCDCGLVMTGYVMLCGSLMLRERRMNVTMRQKGSTGLDCCVF